MSKPQGDPAFRQVLIRLPVDAAAEVEHLATEETRSVSGQVVQLVREALSARKVKDA